MVHLIIPFHTFELSQLFVLEYGMSTPNHHYMADHNGASVGLSNPSHTDNIISQWCVSCTILDDVRLFYIIPPGVKLLT